MEQLSMTPISHAEALRAQAAEKAYRKAADARDAVAWRAPGVSRFDSRPANDTGVAEPTIKELLSDLPPWVTVVAGGVVAASMGALLGGALHI
ncbi:MAG: hypothetical protein EBR82_03270 [Caulobacteraceae bacterium]|nr:hypothetical protein [Caulobacteraceae bacterium]